MAQGIQIQTFLETAPRAQVLTGTTTDSSIVPLIQIFTIQFQQIFQYTKVIINSKEAIVANHFTCPPSMELLLFLLFSPVSGLNESQSLQKALELLSYLLTR